MILDNPALALNINVQDLNSIIEKTLRERNWKSFEMMDIKLVYTPFYLFNYDVLLEQKVEQQTYSQGSSGVSAINAITGRLEPFLVEIMNRQPVKYEKDITHGLQFDVEQAAIRQAELQDTCKIKMAGQFSVGKEAIAVSGFRLIYWPVWKVFVTLPNNIQRMEVDAVAGYTLNLEEVPKREIGWIEVTAETINKLKTPEGWKELTKTALSVTTAGFKGAAGKEAKGKAGGVSYWLFHTRMGRYTILFLIILILVAFYIFPR